jgi:arginine/ornithine transport system substrate-binding protein
MRAVQALVLVSASLGALTGAAAWGESLTLGNEGTYPPFSMIEADGTLKGLEPELARAMCERLGAECQIQAMDFNALLPSLVSGKIDMIASQLWPTPERLEKAEFTDPVLFNPNAFIVQKSWDKGYSPQDMAGQRVAVIQGVLSRGWWKFAGGDLRCGGGYVIMRRDRWAWRRGARQASPNRRPCA